MGYVQGVGESSRNSVNDNEMTQAERAFRKMDITYTRGSILVTIQVFQRSLVGVYEKLRRIVFAYNPQSVPIYPHMSLT